MNKNDYSLDVLLTAAKDALIKAEVIVYQTETFYALGAKYDNAKALEKIYALKKRPKQNVFPLIIGEKKTLDLIVSEVNDVQERLMNKYWPGPLTILFNARSDLCSMPDISSMPRISSMIVGQRNKVAVRMPGESFALELAKTLNFPITSTSANLSGQPPAADVSELPTHFFRDENVVIIDCGRAKGGLASTIADVIEGKVKIIRQGACIIDM
ncbi:Sua5/YciO/YrdC/YwlC family protein [Candidatus Magnetoovum chiemensis]|nr:Sua5/YciO/YrdC/YwlC family protein [Candidatus Magnetoovum chiemensis]